MDAVVPFVAVGEGASAVAVSLGWAAGDTAGAVSPDGAAAEGISEFPADRAAGVPSEAEAG